MLYLHCFTPVFFFFTTFTSKIPYLCQYGESDYKYLQRLAHQYNEWIYFNGVDFIFGKPKSGDQKPIELEYSKDLKDVQIKIKTFNPNLSTYSYNSLADENHKGKSSATKDGLNSLGNTALNASKDLYKESKDYSVSDFFLQDKSSLDDYLEKRLQSLSSTGNILEVEGTQKELQIGSIVKLSAGIPTEEGKYEQQPYGEYIIIQISHFAGDGGAYRNKFTAIPSSVKGLPLNEHISKQKVGNQIAKVISTADPEGKGRIQVQFPWQEENNEKTDFIRVMTPNAGSSSLTETNRGFVFVPEEGDQVMIGFEYDDPNRPFVMGSLFTGKTGAGGDEKNVKKSIVTRSGHTIELDDTDDAQKITIKDNGGSVIMFDTKEKSLFIQATENIEFEAKNIKMTASENVEIQTEKETKIMSKSDLTILSQAKIDVQSDQDTTISSGGKASIEVTSDAELKGQNATIEGKVGAIVKGQQTKLEGQMTSVKGATSKMDII